MTNTGIKRGQAITFRIPSDTPDHLLKQLQKLKETERRNFSSKVAGFVMEGVTESLSHDKETLTLPLPKRLSKSQRDWLKHEHSEALLGNILYQLLADPVRAASILASLNSSSLDIDEALYLQETETEQAPEVINRPAEDTAETPTMENGSSEDDLMNFDWEKAKQEQAPASEENSEEKEESVDDLLGGFLSRMND